MICPGIELELPRVRDKDKVIFEWESFILIIYFFNRIDNIASLYNWIRNIFNILFNQIFKFEQNQ